MTEQELKEKVAKLIERACSKYEDAYDRKLLVKVHADEIDSLYKKAGYFKEEAELVGRLIEKGWIPPGEIYDLTMKAKKSGWDDCIIWHKAEGYVKLADNQELPSWLLGFFFGGEQTVVAQQLRKAGFRKVKL